MKTVVLCSSGAFYKHVNELAEKLQAMGYGAVVPATARDMKTSGDYDINKVKVWYKDQQKAYIKQDKMHGHFEEVARGDAILIVNDDKPGKQAYIGPNGFMEWGLAVYLNKPVFILNAVPKDALYWEEALTATVINGDLGKIKL